MNAVLVRQTLRAPGNYRMCSRIDLMGDHLVLVVFCVPPLPFSLIFFPGIHVKCEFEWWLCCTRYWFVHIQIFGFSFGGPHPSVMTCFCSCLRLNLILCWLSHPSMMFCVCVWIRLKRKHRLPFCNTCLVHNFHFDTMAAACQAASFRYHNLCNCEPRVWLMRVWRDWTLRVFGNFQSQYYVNVIKARNPEISSSVSVGLLLRL